MTCHHILGQQRKWYFCCTHRYGSSTRSLIMFTSCGHRNMSCHMCLNKFTAGSTYVSLHVLCLIWKQSLKTLYSFLIYIFWLEIDVDMLVTNVSWNKCNLKSTTIHNCSQGQPATSPPLNASTAHTGQPAEIHKTRGPSTGRASDCHTTPFQGRNFLLQTCELFWTN